MSRLIDGQELDDRQPFTRLENGKIVEANRLYHNADRLLYREAEKLINGRKSKKIGNNTFVKRIADSDIPALAIRLHDTDVVTLFSDGTIQLRTGGRKTNTTKSRINDWLPISWHLSSIKREWRLQRYVCTNGEGRCKTNDVPFEEGVCIYPKQNDY